MEISLFDDAEFLKDPYAAYAILRENKPCFYDNKTNNYYISRFNDVKKILNDFRVFSPHKALEYREQGQLEYDKSCSFDFKPIFMMSPPEHTRMRMLTNSLFSPKRLYRIEESIKKISVTTAEIYAGKSFDVIGAYAVPIVMSVIFDMLSIPVKDRDFLGEHMNRVLSEGDKNALSSILTYFRGHVYRHSSGIEPGLLYDLFNARSGLDKLTENEVFGLAVIIFFIAPEDLFRSFGSVFSAMDQFPDKSLALYLSGKLEMGKILSESLRLYPTTHYLRRVATRAASFHDVHVPEGSSIVVLLGSANRDSDVFCEPDTFDPFRSNLQYSLSFGSGTHYCLGKHLSEMIINISVTELLKKISNFTVDYNRSHLVHNSPIIGYENLFINT